MPTAHTPSYYKTDYKRLNGAGSKEEDSGKYKFRGGRCRHRRPGFVRYQLPPHKKPSSSIGVMVINRTITPNGKGLRLLTTNLVTIWYDIFGGSLTLQINEFRDFEGFKFYFWEGCINTFCDNCSRN